MYSFYQKLSGGFRASVSQDIDKPGVKCEVCIRNPLHAIMESYMPWFEAGLAVGGEDKGIMCSLRLFGSGLCLGLTDIIPRSTVKAISEWAKRNAHPGYGQYDLDFIYGHARNSRISIGRTNSLVLWHTDMSWSKADRKNWPWLTHGWEFSLNWFDFIFGTHRYEERPLYTSDTSSEGVKDSPVVFLFDAQDGHGPLPYEGKVTIVQVRAPRRFWGYDWKYRGSIEVENPPKYAGKGENSYDLGDDATYSISWGAEDVCPTIQMMVERYVESVDKSIAKYGAATGRTDDDDSRDEGNGENDWVAFGEAATTSR